MTNLFLWFMMGGLGGIAGLAVGYIICIMVNKTLRN